jgi:hypothetical protein
VLILINRFKRLSVEERVNALSTVCPHLTETFINMYQRQRDEQQIGKGFFARTGPTGHHLHHPHETKYFTGSPSPYHPLSHHPYSVGLNPFFQASDSTLFSPYASNPYSLQQSHQSSFEGMYYYRSSSEAEFNSLKNTERVKFEAEQVTPPIFTLFRQYSRA